MTLPEGAEGHHHTTGCDQEGKHTFLKFGATMEAFHAAMIIEVIIALARAGLRLFDMGSVNICNIHT